MTRRPVEILLVEDAPGDIWLIRETLQEGPIQKNIHAVSNGEQALEFLHKQGRFADAIRPDLILLDLNLPRRNGFEVLREIKSDPVLRTITVIVLTTSGAPSDVNTAYDLNANCYVVKPSNLEDFTLAIHAIERFWISMALLPTLAPDGPAMKTGSAEKVQAVGESTNGQTLSSHRRPAPRPMGRIRGARSQNGSLLARKRSRAFFAAFLFLICLSKFAFGALPVILDTDIGDDIDDALALSLALQSPELNVLAIITVLQDGDRRADLVWKILELHGRTDIPVGVGAEQPLHRARSHWDGSANGSSLTQQTACPQICAVTDSSC